MKPIPGWDEVPAYTGEAMQLPAGLYVCIVKQATEQFTQDGRSQLAICFDIADGEYRDFYKKQFESRKQTSSDAKWGGVHKQFTQGKGLPFFKGMICGIEKSNNGYKWDWNEKGLVGKRFGGVFGREQFLTQSGEKRFATKLVQIRSVDGLKEAVIPEDKLLTPDPAPVDPLLAASGKPDTLGFMNIPDGLEDEQLPFM